MKSSDIIQIRRRRDTNTGKYSTRIFSVFRILAVLIFLSAALVVTAGSVAYAILSQKLPSVTGFEQYFQKKPAPTVIYDRSGSHLLLTLRSADMGSQFLAIDDPDTESFSENLIRIIIPSRDPNFWNHSGSAGWDQLLNPEPVTIAEELIERIYGNRLGTGPGKAILLRVLAREITEIYGRQKILTWYLNTAYFGQFAFGADAAARTYLNKSSSALTLPESVLLCAILRAPALNPIDSQGAVRESYLSEVEILSEQHVLTDDEINTLKTTNFVIYEPMEPDYRIRENPILQKSLTTAYEELGQEEVERGGFTILSTIDYDLQKKLECLVSPGSVTNSDTGDCPLLESSLFTDSNTTKIKEVLSKNPISVTLIDVETGQLLAAIDTETGDSAERIYKKDFTPHEPGSSLTPFIALSALNMGYAPSTMVWDLSEQSTSVPAGFSNPDGQSHGPVSLRTALSQDYLGPVSELLQKLGSGNVWNLAAKFGLNGISTKNSEDVIFSGGAVTAETLATIYIPFANRGSLTRTENHGTPRNISILTISDENGMTYNLQPASTVSLLDKGLAYLIYHIFGEENQAFMYLDRPAATKIGRVVGKDETWMVGFTPQIAAAVWVGGVEDSDSDETILKSAISLWQTIMEIAHEGKRVIGWDIPDNISHRMVCTPSGLLPGAACPQTVSEVFLSGSEPAAVDDLYVSLPINRNNQLLATAFTPAESIVYKTYMSLPEYAKSWTETNKIDLIPSEFDPVVNSEQGDAVLKIIIPQPFSIFRRDQKTSEPVDIIVDIQIPETIQYYQISFGSGLFPQTWTAGLTGNELSVGRQNIGSLDTAALDPGLYDVRVSVITESQKYYHTDTYITVQ
ncbi:MAG: transglycosylase domain-containing protein [Flexilinea sp.]